MLHVAFVPSLRGLGILSFPIPGTAVPGYRLFRPFGTGLLAKGNYHLVGETYQKVRLSRKQPVSPTHGEVRIESVSSQIVASFRDWPLG